MPRLLLIVAFIMFGCGRQGPLTLDKGACQDDQSACQGAFVDPLKKL